MDKGKGNGGSNRPADIERTQIDTVDGISAEVLFIIPKPTSFVSNIMVGKKAGKPPLVFLHGSFHAAWCWAEKFFPYFADLGYPVVALSWRGTNGTFAGEGVKKVKAAEHCQDLDAFLSQLPDILGSKLAGDASAPKPVVIGHSFGGIIIMKYLEKCGKKPSDVFGGIVMMCSVPPSGNGKMTSRFLRRSLVQSWKITAGLALKKCIGDRALCRDLFFGGQPVEAADGSVDDLGVSDEDLVRYQGCFERDTAATIDLLNLGRNLPSKATDGEGRAPFAADLPPCMVLGASDDFIVDQEGNEETARYLGLDAPVVVDSPHDVMLGAKWKNAAATLRDFVERL